MTKVPVAQVTFDVADGPLYSDGSLLDGRWCPRGGTAVVQLKEGLLHKAWISPLSGDRQQTINVAEHAGPAGAAPRIRGGKAD